jgi:serine/threonine-protein kinase HipA
MIIHNPADLGARYGVRSPSPFALLEHVGEDCAGAVQYVRPERLDAVLDRKPIPVQWLTEREVGARPKPSCSTG